MSSIGVPRESANAHIKCMRHFGLVRVLLPDWPLIGLWFGLPVRRSHSCPHAWAGPASECFAVKRTEADTKGLHICRLLLALWGVRRMWGELEERVAAKYLETEWIALLCDPATQVNPPMMRCVSLFAAHGFDMHAAALSGVFIHLPREAESEWGCTITNADTGHVEEERSIVGRRVCSMENTRKWRHGAHRV